jgi:hypothetical protein
MIGQYLDEATYTYVQALSRYQARDFEAACEFAAASGDRSRLVQILISRAFHSNTDHSTLCHRRIVYRSKKSYRGASNSADGLIVCSKSTQQKVPRSFTQAAHTAACSAECYVTRIGDSQVLNQEAIVGSNWYHETHAEWARHEYAAQQA